MKILLTWLGVIGCGVANGFLYTRFGSPENLVFVLCASAVCVALLIFHRLISKNWKASDGFRFPLFRISLFFSLFILTMLFIMQEATTTGIVACISVALASFMGHIRERQYTEDWIRWKVSWKKEGSWFSYLFLFINHLRLLSEDWDNSTEYKSYNEWCNHNKHQ